MFEKRETKLFQIETLKNNFIDSSNDYLFIVNLLSILD